MQATSSVAPSLQAQLLETAELRKNKGLAATIKKEIDQIENQLKQTAMDDPVTEEIVNWLHNFKTALELNVDSKQVLDQFINLLKVSLRDPLTNYPFNENAVLGSDMKTYNPETLEQYRHHVREEYRNRSPLNPNHDEILRTRPHHNVRYLIAWLQSHNALPRADEVKRPQREAMESKKAEPPTSKKDRIRRIRQLHQAAEPEREIDQNVANLQNFGNQLLQQVEQRYAQREQREEQSQQARMQRAVNIERQDQEQLQELQRMMDQHQQNLDALEQQNREIADQIAEGHEQLAEAELDNLRLQQKINAVKQAQEKKKKSLLKEITAAALIVGVAVFATWALNGALTAVSSMLKGTVICQKSSVMVSVGIAL